MNSGRTPGQHVIRAAFLALQNNQPYTFPQDCLDDGSGYLGTTLLLMAVAHRDVATVARVLFKDSKRLNEQYCIRANQEKLAPLHIAARHFLPEDADALQNQLILTWLLLSYGADPNIKTSNGYTALSFALEGVPPLTEITLAGFSKALVKLLLIFGADIDLALRALPYKKPYLSLLGKCQYEINNNVSQMTVNNIYKQYLQPQLAAQLIGVQESFFDDWVVNNTATHFFNYLESRKQIIHAKPPETEYAQIKLFATQYLNKILNNTIKDYQTVIPQLVIWVTQYPQVVAEILCEMQYNHPQKISIYLGIITLYGNAQQLQCLMDHWIVRLGYQQKNLSTLMQQCLAAVIMRKEADKVQYLLATGLCFKTQDELKKFFVPSRMLSLTTMFATDIEKLFIYHTSCINKITQQKIPSRFINKVFFRVAIRTIIAGGTSTVSALLKTYYANFMHDCAFLLAVAQQNGRFDVAKVIAQIYQLDLSSKNQVQQENSSWTRGNVSSASTPLLDWFMAEETDLASDGIGDGDL